MSIKTPSPIYRPLEVEGAMCIFRTFEKNAFKGLKLDEKSDCYY